MNWMLLFSETLPEPIARGQRSGDAHGRFMPYFSRPAWQNARQSIRESEDGPKQEPVSLLEHVKADGFDIGRSNAEAVALLLSDLCHAKIFRIRILNRDAIGLLSHQAVETSRSYLDALSLAASGILRVSTCGGKQRQKKYQFTHASEGQSLRGF